MAQKAQLLLTAGDSEQSNRISSGDWEVSWEVYPKWAPSVCLSPQGLGYNWRAHLLCICTLFFLCRTSFQLPPLNNNYGFRLFSFLIFFFKVQGKVPKTLFDPCPVHGMQSCLALPGLLSRHTLLMIFILQPSHNAFWVQFYLFLFLYGSEFQPRKWQPKEK